MKSSVVLACLAAVVTARCGIEYGVCNDGSDIEQCCESSMFECHKSESGYTCQPSWGSVMNAQGAGLWGQCGGKTFKGDTQCPQGSKCVKVNDYYFQCQKLATTPDRFPTYAQCGGTNNNFQANGKTCRDEDMCFHFSKYFWQCIPKTVVYDHV
ncbi:hypothetical protein THRCLA_09604 [Thraustotheca clavata]|uniref:Secreted protein n=1 Tax=Thraustotheca clavata TaxID=74557 RepID=A0A0A7CMN3_9STRA|nr:secreted protein [Thraustotheca clavata]OQR89737.1 hypothetical protein THRCLA_09604 [Thraustotheca clavata]